LYQFWAFSSSDLYIQSSDGWQGPAQEGDWGLFLADDAHKIFKTNVL
jgi:hypothetical protein